MTEKDTIDVLMKEKYKLEHEIRRLKEDCACLEKEIGYLHSTLDSIADILKVHHDDNSSTARDQHNSGYETIDYNTTRYFDSLRGKIQYFVFNHDDSYVLNSYEKVDYSHFLYRFLKEQGFDRVITVENVDGKFDIFAFDKLSELSFANPAGFRNVRSVQDRDSINDFYNSMAETRPLLTRHGRNEQSFLNHASPMRDTPEFGKRRINIPTINSKEVFQATINQYICPALRSGNARTCIVLPIELLTYNEYLTPQIASLINSAIRDAKKDPNNCNILLITASKTEDFNAIMEQSYSLFRQLEPEINRAYVNASHEERFGAFLVRQLINESRILIADECPHADEIANVIFALKDEYMHDLQPTKIYALADYIYKSNEFNTSVNEILKMPDSRNILTVDFLERVFSDSKIADALVKKSKELKDRQPVRYNNLPSSYVSRVVGDVQRSIISQAEIDEEVNSILLEMDALVGMEAVKNQILELMSPMEGDLWSFRKGEIKELPYQNMILVGPPGTGKTTVAQLVARLMCAKGILPKETTVIRTPADYINVGHVGYLTDALQADIESAVGGVILFDEFYNFNQGHSAGNMANDALAAIMDGADKYKGRICIIIAGYEKQVMETLAFNPGAERRFPNKIVFTSYSTQDIVEIFRRQVVASGFKEPDESVLRAIEPIVDTEKADKRDKFANARFVTDTLFPAIRRKYAMRKADDYVITVEDVHKAFPCITDINKDNKEKPCRLDKSIFANTVASIYDINKDYQLFKEISRGAMLRIQTETGAVGTAFIIHPKGYALTCNHLVVDNNGEPLSKVSARYGFFGKEDVNGEVPVHVVMTDTFSDLAVVKIETESVRNGDMIPYLSISKEAASMEDYTGEECILLGFPYGSETVRGKTVEIGGVRKLSNGVRCYLTSDSSHPGMSGAPIIQAKTGKVIGVLIGAEKNDVVGTVIPITYFWKDMVK